MNDTALLITLLGTIGGVIQAIFWRWVTAINEARKEDKRKIEMVKADLVKLQSEVYRDYQSKANAHLDNQRILESLNDLKADVKELGQKLDKKVDK